MRQLVPGGQVPAMLLHLLGGEQLRAQRRLVQQRWFPLCHFNRQNTERPYVNLCRQQVT